jgi:deoxyadenosine/deoxycytidine kinase
MYYDEQIDMTLIEEYKRRLRTSVDQNEMMKWSMDLQTSIMRRRESVLQKACADVAKGRAVVIERGTLGNLVFALNALKKFVAERDTLKLFSQYMLHLVGEIIKRAAIGNVFYLTIYLKTPLEESIRRNKLRDNEAYDPEYLRQLQELYELMLNVHKDDDVVVFDMEAINARLGYKSVFDMVERDLARSASQFVYTRTVFDELVKDVWTAHAARSAATGSADA